jgi:hypothetical protein
MNLKDWYKKNVTRSCPDHACDQCGDDWDCTPLTGAKEHISGITWAYESTCPGCTSDNEAEDIRENDECDCEDCTGDS